MKLNKPIKTIRDAYNAVREICPDECIVRTAKTITHSIDRYGKAQETKHTVCLVWNEPPDAKGKLVVVGIGKTPRQAFFKFLDELKTTLAERNGLTGIDLSALQVAALNIQAFNPKRLTHVER